MFIICPKCFAKYQISDDVHLKNGQKLKCSACEHIFEKGEEAPLVLEEPAGNPPIRTENETVERAPVSSQPQQNSTSFERAPVDEAFKAPLFNRGFEENANQAFVDPSLSSPTAPNHPVNALPEAFVPVADKHKNKKNGGLFFVFVYIIAIFGLCWAAWVYRETLTPAFYAFMPSPANDSVKQVGVEPDKTIKNENPLSVEAAMAPAIPTPVLPVVVKEEGTLNQYKKDETPDVSKHVTVQGAQKAEDGEIPVVPVKDSAEYQAKSELNKTENIKEPVAPVDAPAEADVAVEKEKLPETPKTDAEEVLAPVDEEPLFEVIAEPGLPETSFVIRDVSFRTVADAANEKQLLIEGVLYNQTADSLDVPVLTASVIGPDGQILSQKKVYLTQEKIDGGQHISFFTGVTPAPEQVNRVEVVF